MIHQSFERRIARELLKETLRALDIYRTFKFLSISRVLGNVGESTLRVGRDVLVEWPCKT